MILIYRMLIFISYPCLITFIYLRKFFKKEHKDRYKEKIFPNHFNVKRIDDRKKLIWFHAASIGEFNSILPLINEFNKSRDDLEFLLTTVTLSSSNLAKKEFKNIQNIQHRFFPLDINFLIEKFLISWRPSAIFLVDSEIWPNLIFKSKDLKIPLVLINARITFRSFQRWNLISAFAKKIFNSFDLCLASGNDSFKFLERLNARNIFNLGNLKLANSINLENIKNLNEDILVKKKFWVSASTHRGEEEFCIRAHLKVKERYKNAITIIAPRHINRVGEIKRLCDSYNLNSQILKDGELILKNNEIIILNSFGVLQTYFKFSSSVFIGKSTLKKIENVSGQSPIDAANCGCKIYHGPFVYNFKDIYKILEQNKISKEIKTYHELAKNLISDFDNNLETHKKVSNVMINLNKKTLRNYTTYINEFLKHENI